MAQRADDQDDVPVSVAFRRSAVGRAARRVLRSLRRAKEVFLWGTSLRESVLVWLLLRHYRSRLRLARRLSEEAPHFYEHRWGISEWAFGSGTSGAEPYRRAFYAAECVRDGDRVLDIGCGDGFFTQRFLGARATMVDGVDVEPDAIRTATRYQRGANVRFHLADATAVPFPTAPYDLIVWDGAIAHFAPEAVDRMLAKIREALAPEGVFCGSESLGEEGRDHLQSFPNVESLRTLLCRCFPVVQVREVAYRLPGSGLLRREGYWRAALSPGRLVDLAWR